MGVATQLRWVVPLLLVVAFSVYFPALNRLFYDDQVAYFTELDGRTGLADGLRHYDYSVTRRFSKGDDGLFRPLLFVLLAVENSLFSYHHQWWNAGNVALHALVAVCLFSLLMAIRPSMFALPMALLFVVMKPAVPLVVANHMGGYILGCAFFITGMRAFVLMLRSADASPSVPVVYVLSFTAASLCHEALAVAGLLAGVMVLWVEWRRGKPLSGGRVLVLLLPAIIFSALYAIHLLRVERLTYVDRRDLVSTFSLANLWSLFPATLNTMILWIREAALPLTTEYWPDTYGGDGISFEFSWSAPLHLLNLLLFAMAAIVVVASGSWRRLQETFPLLVLLAGAAVAYTAVISFGRGLFIWLWPHYSYPFCLLLVVAAYAVLEFDKVRGATARVMAAVLLSFWVLHATQSRADAREVGRVSRSPSEYLTAVTRFVDAHRAEPDFSFVIAEHPPEDPELDQYEGYPDEPGRLDQRHVTEILFTRYYERNNPKYVLRCRPDNPADPRQWTCLSQSSLRPPE